MKTGIRLALVVWTASVIAAQPVSAQNIFEKLGDTASGVYRTVTSGHKLQKAKEVPVETDAFGETLYNGYIGLSESEFHKGDYGDSDVFAIRAMAAARNEPTAPEQIASRDLRAELLNELSSARRRVVVAEVRGAKGIAPVDLADTQVSYECWMEEQEEDFQSEDIAACRNKFFLVIARVEDSLKQDIRFEPKPADPIRLDIFFEFDSAELSDGAISLIREIVGSLDIYKKPLVTLTGHADKVGADNYNYELAKKRARAVADAFDGLGIVVAGVYSFGEEAPLIEQVEPETEPERLNRRVTIIMREDPER